MEKPDLLETIQNEGFEPRKAGSTYRMHCPFHQERNPSLYIYPSRRWKCFGCQRGGDVYDFIQELKGLSFKEAVAYLGGMIEAPDREEIETRKLIREFRKWESDYRGALLDEARNTQRKIWSVETTADMIEAAESYHKLAVIDYKLSILASDDDEAKLNLMEDQARGDLQSRR